MTVTKTFTDVEIKSADLGQIEAVFATFDVIDLDGDVTRKGAFTEGAPVVISAYGHTSWDGALPIGKGTIHEVGDKAVMRGQFFLDTTHGRDAWNTIKNLTGVQEWSYSLHDVDAEPGVVEGKSVRVIKRVAVKEVSPVLRGAAGEGRTGTIATKSTKQLESSLSRLLSRAGRDRWEIATAAPYTWCYLDDYDADNGYAVFGIETRGTSTLIQVSFTYTDTSVTLGDEETEVHRTATYLAKSAKFSQRADAALADVKAFVEMARERLTQRAQAGKSIDEQRAAYDELIASVAPLKAAIDELDQADAPEVETPPSNDDAVREYLRFVAITQGVTS